MTKLSFGAHPYLLGFEQLERLVERTAKSGAEGYPPFNIEAVAENAYRITLAVAGFREEDLSITIEDRQLVVRGRQTEDVGDRFADEARKIDYGESEERGIRGQAPSSGSTGSRPVGLTRLRTSLPKKSTTPLRTTR